MFGSVADTSDETVTKTSVELRVTLALIDEVIDGLLGGIVGANTDMLMEVSLVAAAFVAITLAVVMVVAMRAGTIVDLLTGVVMDAGVDVDTWPFAIIALEFMPMLTPSDEALPFGWGACSCWPTTV